MPATRAQLFELDAELLTYVPAAERSMAQRVAQVSVERLAPGRWDPQDLDAPLWGVLVVEGMIAREVAVAGSSAAELLGSGDVLYPQVAASEELVTSEAAWTVLEAARVASLDDHLAPVVRRWPGVTACLLARSARRAQRLATMQAITHLTRVDSRVLATLWLLADRWGRVTAEGIVLPLRLTHRTIARLVGARRPSVTSAITELSGRGLLARRDDGSWMLHGPPPEELERAGAHGAISAAAAQPRPAARPRGPVDPASVRSTVARMQTLVTLYERQHARAEEIGRTSRITRERARRLREETQQTLAALSRRSGAPPSG